MVGTQDIHGIGSQSRCFALTGERNISRIRAERREAWEAVRVQESDGAAMKRGKGVESAGCHATMEPSHTRERKGRSGGGWSAATPMRVRVYTGPFSERRVLSRRYHEPRFTNSAVAHCYALEKLWYPATRTLSAARTRPATRHYTPVIGRLFAILPKSNLLVRVSPVHYHPIRIHK